ncbi:hypothetical protein R5R35_014325 [Gryllus longicercus]|uniref:Uncharacterized protein n=1 Tax=Gryllus longicercus TaxID=2509291 RepID=A0AAN9VEY5_9ORTH|nr:Uncharacterized protein GBIM_06697 [Gryllus bimaculatus]
MADGLCVEGTANNDNGTAVKETVDLLGMSHKDSLNSKGLNSLKSTFYINGESGELCSNFRVNGVVTLGVHASRDMLCSANTEHVDFTSLCPDAGDNCRKKRCADRYDSSESSDR